MATFRLIAFDLDGTLVDSRRDIADAANDVLIECGAEPLTEAAIGRMVGEGAATLIARVFAAAGIARPVDALDRFLRCYDRRLVSHTRPYTGIEAVLTALQPQAVLAVLTNKPLAATRQVLDGLALSRFFEPALVLGGDGPLPRKPDPAGLLALAASIGTTPSDTCLVGDSYVDWQTAQAAGATSCLARYGFGFDSVPAAILTTAQRIVDRPDELLDALAR